MGGDMDSEYFVSINEVAKRLSVPAHTLRYWERQFPTAIRPTTGAGGRRYYRTETVERLNTIKELLYTRGMTIAGVKKLIHDGELPKSASEFTVAKRGAETPVNTGQKVVINASKSSDEIDTVITLLNTAREILTTI